MDKFGSRSPLPSKKQEPLAQSLSLNEVQGSLKVIRQKRLSRLSAFVAEQHRLLEARSETISQEAVGKRTKEASKISSGNHLTTSFSVISEESDSRNRANCTKGVVKMNVKEKVDQDLNKSLSKRKFLNKFNCVVNQSNFSSSDDDQEKLESDADINNVGNYEQENLYVINLNEKFDVNSVQKLSQRKPIYFSEKTALDPLQSENQKLFTSMQAEVGENQTIKAASGNNFIPDMHTATSSRNVSLTPIVPVKNDLGKKISSFSHVFGVNKTDEFKLKYSKNTESNSVKDLQKNTLNLSNEEKVLKKLQVNYLTVTKLLNGDSEDDDCHIDSDEMEDFTNTLNDTKKILTNYEKKIRELQWKLPYRKLNNIRKGLEDIRRQIDNFRGLRRDNFYSDTLNKFSLYKEELGLFSNKIKQKQEIAEYLNLCLILLEDKVNKNQFTLYELLNNLVDIISKNKIKETYL